MAGVVKNQRRMPVVKLRGNRHKYLRHGRALISAMSEKECEALYSSLDVIQQRLFTQVSNYCYSTGG